MKKLIILLLYCGVLVSMVGCGGNTASPPTESPPATVTETAITETPTETTLPVTTVEPGEKEKELTPTENEDRATEPTVTATEPTTTATPTEEIKTTVTSIAEEKDTRPIKETAPPKLTEPEPTEMPATFDIDHWIAYARNYAESKGLILSSTAVDCWDNPIRAGAHCIYLERDIQSRLVRYAKDEDITDVWIWAKATGNNCYDIYIGYA